MALKAPKKKKYPKKPKATASSASMQAWLDKVKAIDKEFDKALSEYEKEQKLKKSLKQKITTHKR